MNFNEELNAKTEEINRILEAFLPAEEGYQRQLLAAMNYSMQAGGKRLRPLMMQEAYRMFGGSGAVVQPFMAAMEMIHTHSLIHDDLPAMDNDEYRRGRKTTHVVYGEAAAILAGDGLLNLAYETAMKAFALEPENRNIPRALTLLAGKTGIYGMIGGQSVDVEMDKAEGGFAGQPEKKERLDFIYRLKTGALIEGSLMVGAVLAGTSGEELAILEEIGGLVGMAFQIQDDILDLTSTTETLGKPVHSDEKNDKVTYVTLYGMEEAKAAVERISREAIEKLNRLPGDKSFLEPLFLSLIHRKK